MDAALVELGSYQKERNYCINLSGRALLLPTKESLAFGECLSVNAHTLFIEGKHFSLEAGLNILYREGGSLERVHIHLNDQPPKDEAYLQILHLNVSVPLVSAKARYGDRIVKRLPFKMSSNPMLVYAPMDLPIDFYSIDHERIESTEGYVTKSDSYILFTLIEHAEQSLWGIEIK